MYNTHEDVQQNFLLVFSEFSRGSRGDVDFHHRGWTRR